MKCERGLLVLFLDQTLLSLKPIKEWWDDWDSTIPNSWISILTRILSIGINNKFGQNSFSVYTVFQLRISTLNLLLLPCLLPMVCSRYLLILDLRYKYPTSIQVCSKRHLCWSIFNSQVQTKN